MGRRQRTSRNTPIFQYSNIPSLHHSITPPLPPSTLNPTTHGGQPMNRREFLEGSLGTVVAAGALAGRAGAGEAPDDGLVSPRHVKVVGWVVPAASRPGSPTSPEPASNPCVSSRSLAELRRGPHQAPRRPGRGLRAQTARLRQPPHLDLRPLRRRNAPARRDAGDGGRGGGVKGSDRSTFGRQEGSGFRVQDFAFHARWQMLNPEP